MSKKGGRSGLIGGDGRDSLRDVEILRNEGLSVNGIEGRGIVKSLVEHIESKAFAKDMFIDQASVHVSSHPSGIVAPGALARDIHRGNAYDNGIDATTTLTTDPSNPKPLIEPCSVCPDDIPIPDFDKHIDQ